MLPTSFLKKWKKKLILTSLVLFLSACSSSNTDPVDILLEPPSISPIETRKVEFKVSSDGNQAFYSITPQTYENLSYNVQEMLRYIREQKAVIEYYENIYKTNTQ